MIVIFRPPTIGGESYRVFGNLTLASMLYSSRELVSMILRAPGSCGSTQVSSMSQLNQLSPTFVRGSWTCFILGLSRSYVVRRLAITRTFSQVSRVAISGSAVITETVVPVYPEDQ